MRYIVLLHLGYTKMCLCESLSSVKMFESGRSFPEQSLNNASVLVVLKSKIDRQIDGQNRQKSKRIQRPLESLIIRRTSIKWINGSNEAATVYKLLAAVILFPRVNRGDTVGWMAVSFHRQVTLLHLSTEDGAKDKRLNIILCSSVYMSTLASRILSDNTLFAYYYKRVQQAYVYINKFLSLSLSIYIIMTTRILFSVVQIPQSRNACYSRKSSRSVYHRPNSIGNSIIIIIWWQLST